MLLRSYGESRKKLPESYTLVEYPSTYKLHGADTTMVVVGKSEGRSLLERPRRRWEDNILTNL
jgi:hypothetical protein